MSWVQLRTEDVLAAATGTLQEFNDERKAQFDSWVEDEMHRWWAPVRKIKLREAESKVRQSARWFRFCQASEDPISRVEAIIMACQMSASTMIYLNLTDFQLIKVGHY